ncbi:MAG: lamin tail domain-containing protein, partial [Candidatus Marinimicrobia bacterium]|nr:lamin tail domain-containing protein [Candidatus Neomarinimicrobiota bacterium]
NLSETDTVDLTGWLIKDKYSTDDLLDSGYGLIIPPQSYGIIFEGDYNFNSGIYINSIPDGVVLIKVDDSSIGNGLSTSDSLYLISNTGVVQDSVGWTDIAPDGFSLEKVRIELPNNPNNWLPSIDSLGTPGRINSVDPFTIDGQIIADSLRINPSIIEMNSTTIISGYVTNNGRSTISGDVEILEVNNILESIYFSNLAELDTAEFSVAVGPFPSGNHELIVRFVVSNDENESNNEAAIVLGVRYPVGLLTINEFLPNPESGAPEFVELFYHGSESVSLFNWGIGDLTGSPALLGDIMIEIENYIVIGGDSSMVNAIPDSSLFITPLSSLPTLNNNGDAIRIFDPFNTLIDSLTYFTNWGYSRGRSMEKIMPDFISADSSNWQPSIEPTGNTPGRRNSVMPWPIDGAIYFSGLTRLPHIPSNTDSIHLQIPVVNLGLDPLSGNIYVEYEDEELASQSILIPVSGDTLLSTLIIPPLPSGEHELLLALDVIHDGNILNNSGNIMLKIRYPFGTIKLNEFMARPNNDQTEFIEVVSFDNLTLSSWSISDNSKQKKLLPDLILEEGDYVIFAADSTLYPLQNEQAHFIVPFNGWPSLNNSGDAIYLYDLTGSIIDSLHYTNSWPITDEISTEKLRPEFDSYIQSNWSLNIDSSGSTPGFSNSVALFDLDGKIVTDSLWHNPFYPKNNESIISFVMVTNSGVTPFFGTILLRIDGDEYGASDFDNIQPGDTLIHALEFGPLISGYHNAEFQLAIQNDENSSNDIAYDSIFVSYEFGAVVLNEFLSIPDSTQTEFVELVPTDNLTMNHWWISDNSLDKREISFGEVEPETYLIIAADSLIVDHLNKEALWSIPKRGLSNLNNFADGIYLYDMTGMVIDSLNYTKSWGIIENRSMEKYRPEFVSSDSSRWAVSVNQSRQTPGAINSVYYNELPKNGVVVFEPNPFSPDGDGFDDLLYIKYKLPFEYGLISIQIFDVIGRTIATLYWNTYTAQENVLTWDGRNKNGKPARIGMYIIKVKATDVSSSQSWEDVQRIILAKKL